MSGLSLTMSADPDDFVEATTEFAARRVITREEADALSDYARKRSWWITGVAQMDVANDAHESILDAMKSGVPYEEWKKKSGSLIEKEWGRKDSPRLLTIFRNATTSAYNAGRLEQMEQPHVTAVRPFKMLDVVDDSRTCPICAKFIDPPVILPWDHVFWLTHSPPFHHCDRCGIRSLRKTVAESKGIMATPPDVTFDDGWGLKPTVAKPPTPSERDVQPDPEIMLEAAVKGGQHARETKPVTIPKRLTKKTA